MVECLPEMFKAAGPAPATGEKEGRREGGKEEGHRKSCTRARGGQCRIGLHRSFFVLGFFKIGS
jgi:hypothetical protein